MKYLLGLLLLVLVGCELAPFVGPMVNIGVWWVEGEAHKYYYSDEGTVEQALRTVLTDMEFDIKKDYADKDGVRHIVADNKKDRQRGRDRRADSFKIKVEPVRHDVTQLSIRVDFMGDKPYAELIYREIDRQTGIRCFQTSNELQGVLKCVKE